MRSRVKSLGPPANTQPHQGPRLERKAHLNTTGEDSYMSCTLHAFMWAKTSQYPSFLCRKSWPRESWAIIGLERALYLALECLVTQQEATDRSPILFQNQLPPLLRKHFLRDNVLFINFLLLITLSHMSVSFVSLWSCFKLWKYINSYYMYYRENETMKFHVRKY